MPRHVQAGAAIQQAIRVAQFRIRQARDRDGSLPAALYKGQAPSLEQHHGYVRSKAWVPPGHEGGVADRFGTLFGNTAGAAGVAAGNVISGVSHKPFRATVAFLAVYVLAVICLVFAGEKTIAAWMGAGLVIFAVVLYGLLRFWPQKKLDSPMREEGN